MVGATETDGLVTTVTATVGEGAAGAGVGVGESARICSGGFRPHQEYARMTMSAIPQTRARVDCLMRDASTLVANFLSCSGQSPQPDTQHDCDDESDPADFQWNHVRRDHHLRVLEETHCVSDREYSEND